MSDPEKRSRQNELSLSARQIKGKKGDIIRTISTFVAPCEEWKQGWVEKGY
tara:strand:- start:269 stop:421 length:153 start_codon:yes stop_codon:yes gene_type:complete